MDSTRPRLPSRTEFLLDALRCSAALLVFLSHWRILLFCDYKFLASPNLLTRGFYFLTGMGRPSVMLFFVLSGYLVTGSAIRSRDSGRWSVFGYLNRRITRLSTVLVPALALCALWDALGLHFRAHGLYDGFILTEALRPQVAARFTFPILIQNLLYLQGVTSPTFGSDDALWSLAYEFWYYIFLIPLLYIVSKNHAILKLVAGMLLLAGLVFVGRNIALYFIIWLLGAGVAVLGRTVKGIRSDYSRLGVWMSAILMAAVLFALRARILPPGFRGDFTLSLSCALFVWMSARDNRITKPTLVVGAARNFAGWSYSLYLLHMPLLVLIASFLAGASGQWYPDGRHLFIAIAVLLVVLAYAYLVSLVTEKRTPALRSWIEAQFRRVAPELVKI
jgi:peptidoglycan/LPS O-acetylase OafA/YrhL